jgi:hypothetical protein
MTLCVEDRNLGTTSPSSPEVSRFTWPAVGSWGRSSTTCNHTELAIHRLIHNPQPLLSLLEDHYFEKGKGKNPQ